MAVIDVSGQPTAGVIGGMTDLTSQITQVSVNRSPADLANVQEGFTSREQGSDYDPVLVSQAETINPDTMGITVAKAIPFVPLLIAGVILYFILRGK